jgi:hypothetical protein
MVEQSPDLQVLMAWQGNPPNFTCKWLNGGAYCSISLDIADFTSNYSTILLNITVAKQNVCMMAIGIGNCELHYLHDMGRPYKMVLHDVLYVPDAGCHIMSASSVGQQCYQTVLSCPNNTQFPPGSFSDHHLSFLCGHWVG